MVLGCLRLFDMISLLFSSGHISHPRRRIPATPPTPPRRAPATPPTPVAGLQPHLPPPSPDPGHTSHARRRTHLPSRGQTVEPEELSDFKLWFLSDSFGSPWTLQHVTDLQSSV